MSQHGKKYRNARAQIDREQAYSPLQAIRMLKEFDGPTFDETVEAHVRLGLNVRHADQQLRGTLMLPHGTGSDVRVAVFAEGEKAKEAEEAGADIVGSADLATRVEGPSGIPASGIVAVARSAPVGRPPLVARTESVRLGGVAPHPLQKSWISALTS